MGQEAPFVAAVVIVVFRGDRLLAMRRARTKDAAPGAWEALSGRVRPGEQPLAAAAREAREECGLEVAIEPRPVTSYVARRNHEEMIVVAFRARSSEGDVTLSDEHDRFAWMTPREFAGACPFPPLIEAVVLASRLSD